MADDNNTDKPVVSEQRQIDSENAFASNLQIVATHQAACETETKL